jgi:hypothetical protein
MYYMDKHWKPLFLKNSDYYPNWVEQWLLHGDRRLNS